MRKITTVLLPVLAFLASLGARAELVIEISRGAERPMPVAIVPLGWQGVGAAPIDVAQIVSNDLASSGRFAPLPVADMVQKPTTSAEVDLQDWRTLGVEAVVVGKLLQSAPGEYTIQFQIMDVLRGEQLLGYRLPRAVYGVDQHLGMRGLFVAAGGWVFDDDVSILATVTHTSEADATIADEDAPGTGSRVTQAALLVIVPISDTLRLRTSAFTDIPPLGVNRPALGGTSISIAKTWL